MNSISRLAIFAVLLLAASLSRTVSTNAANLQMGVSVDRIPVTSSFDGTGIVVFGTIENFEWASLRDGKYSVVIEVTGPKSDVIIRKKDRVLGIWVNRQSRRYTDVPAFYSIASNKPLEDVAGFDERRKLKLGIDGLDFNLLSQGDQTFIAPAPPFSEALRRIKFDSRLFVEDQEALQFLSPTLFRASIRLPANVPIGRHNVKAYLFEDGKFAASSQSEFVVQKAGFERWIYEMAYQNSLLYGIMAVLMAIATGWIANAVFKKD